MPAKPLGRAHELKSLALPGLGDEHHPWGKDRQFFTISLQSNIL